MRLGCLLTTAALLVSLVVEPPKAKAFAVTSSAVSALAGGFLNACGLAPVVSGMSSSSDVNESVARLIQDYLTEDFSMEAPTPEEWLGQEIGLTLTGGKIVVPKPVASKLAQFAVWVASKYGTKTGQNVVYSETSSYVTLADGSRFYLCTGYDSSKRFFSTPGTPIPAHFSPIVFSTGWSMEWQTLSDGDWDFSVRFLDPSGKLYSQKSFDSWELSLRWPLYIGVYEPDIFHRSTFILERSLNAKSLFWSFDKSFDDFDIGTVVNVSESLAIDAAGTVQQILDRLTALEEGQSVALDVGAAQSMEIQEILQGILDAILAGNLAATAEIVDEAVKPVDPDPPAETLPDVDGLGLPALGAALTSRFPFSIPWDVYKGISLLAAPAKAPYFEVDFMAPIADRVGGWKGSTKIVLDFSEFEIIGQVCRWTSTIGFCLMLATATKRLIWTA